MEQAFLLKALIILLLCSLSCEHLGLVLAMHGLSYAKLYLNTVVLVLFGAVRLLSPKPPSLPQTVVVPLVLLHAWILVSFAIVDYPFMLGPIFTYINSLSGLLALIWAAPVIVLYRLQDFTLKAFIIIAGIVSLLGIAHTAISGMPPLGEVSILNANHMHIGLYMILATGSILYYYNEHPTRENAFLCIPVFFLVLAAIVLSGSRAATIACLAIVVIWGWSFKNWKSKVSIIVFIGLAFLALSMQMEDRAQASSSITLSNGMEVDFSLGYRFFMWYGILSVIFSNPITFLIGLGYESLAFKFNELIYFPVYVNAAHNIFLQVWCELGIVGMVLFFMPLLFVLLRLLKISQSIRVTLLPTVIAVILTGLTQETLYANMASGNFNSLFWLIIGLALLHEPTTSSNLKA